MFETTGDEEQEMARRKQRAQHWTVKQRRFHSQEELRQTSISVRVPLRPRQHRPGSSVGVPRPAVQEGEQEGSR